MSDTETRWPHQQASEVAAELQAELEPVTDRVLVVGGLRRKRETVGDIEFLVVPSAAAKADLFGSQPVPDLAVLQNMVHRWGTVLKAGDRMIQVRRPGGLKVELYVVTPPADWYALLCIRTGPAALGRAAVTLMQQYGYRQQDGRLLYRGQPVPLRSEAEWFAAARLPCVPPEERDDLVAVIAAGMLPTLPRAGDPAPPRPDDPGRSQAAQ